MKWIEALQEYNKGKKMWCIPAKGTPEYEQVRALMGNDAKSVSTDKPKKKKIIIVEDNPVTMENKTKSDDSDLITKNFNIMFKKMIKEDQEIWTSDGDDRDVLSFLKKYKIIIPVLDKSVLKFSAIPDFIYRLDNFTGKNKWTVEDFVNVEYLRNPYFIEIMKQIKLKVPGKYYDNNFTMEMIREIYYETLFNGSHLQMSTLKLPEIKEFILNLHTHYEPI
jgi:hypothetical protein